MSDRAGLETHAVVQAGVGIFFQQDVVGKIVAKTLVKGGSAERDGTVQIGDRILSVDDRSVAGESIPVLRSIVLGPQGSAVKMKFARQSSHGAVQEFSISLIRGTSEYFSEKDSSSRPQRLDSGGPSVCPAAAASATFVVAPNGRVLVSAPSPPPTLSSRRPLLSPCDCHLLHRSTTVGFTELPMIDRLTAANLCWMAWTQSLFPPDGIFAMLSTKM